jgi:hypothetical protein
MSSDEPTAQSAEDPLDDLLSEIWHADTQANNASTRELLEAGQALLHDGLACDPRDHNISGEEFQAPFEELLAWISRRRVVRRANKQGRDGRLSESAFRYRWRTQTGYLRDLVIYALRPRMASPQETEKATRVLSEGKPLDQAIERIAYDEVVNLNEDKAFRLQMVFQAILSHDARVADALRRIDETNVQAWRAFYQGALDDLAIRFRPDVSLDDFAYALQTAGEGVVLRSLLPVKNNVPLAAQAIDHDNKTSRPLALIAMALLVAFADPGDGKPLRQVVRELSSDDHRLDPGQVS